MAKTIIFDFWGTLVEQGVYSPIKQVKRLLGLYEMDYSEFVVTFERAMMTEKFDSLHDAFVRVCEAFDIKHDEELIEELIGVWNKNWLLAKPYDETIEILKRLKEQYHLVLVANTDNFSVNGVLEKFKLKDLFQYIFLSCEFGMLKIDDGFYGKILKKINEDVNECLVVGDSVYSDIKPAEDAGIDTILVDRHGKRDYPKKIANLKELKWK